ncbi:hypothetical protein DAPPUDRAFT_337324 [Daphnia pulex]|uniref:Uncharacterized protein n=1 Tax=Daphnia pulex TaxID=6669 RepID=E9I1F3_DAPPU|nr:hypothetical protein DAPPUDRAFT_337324 [Daphnia pulex]|eukprot:EFX62180.1 hypothetical protein DAPPUDRAFT_337324 [Daphnia pulex]
MKPGKYIIIQSDTDQVIGGFEVIGNEIHNLMGIAQGTITDGEITGKNTHEIQRLNNGYMHVEYLEQNDPRPKDHFIVLIDKKKNTKRIYDMHNKLDKDDLYYTYQSFSPDIIQAHLGSDFYVKGFASLGDIKREFRDMKHKHQMNYVTQWAKENGHHSPKFLYKLLRGI